MAESKKNVKASSRQSKGDMGYRLNFTEEFIDISARSSQDIGFTAMDIYENNDSIFVVIELTGVDPNDVSVTVMENRLIIEGTKYENVSGESDVVYHCAERNFGVFRRMFALGAAVDSQNIKASCKSGVLKLQIPKLHERRGKSRLIKVKIDA